MIDRRAAQWTIVSEDDKRRIWARTDTLKQILRRWDSLKGHMLRDGAVSSVKKPLYSRAAEVSKRRLELRENAVMAGDFEAANIKTKRIDHSAIEQ